MRNMFFSVRPPSTESYMMVNFILVNNMTGFKTSLPWKGIIRLIFLWRAWESESWADLAKSVSMPPCEQSFLLSSWSRRRTGDSAGIASSLWSRRSLVYRFSKQNNNSARVSRFFVQFFAELHDFDVKRPNVTFYSGCEQATTNFSFSS